jgi:phage-related baseplate assembly protein
VVGGALIVVGLLGIGLGWGSTTTSPASSAATASTVPTSESPQAFFAAFLAALAAGNHTYLYDRLDPAVIARFGTAECRAAVANLHPLAGERLLAVGPTGNYRFTTSGHSTVVPDVTEFTVQDPAAGVVHLHFALIDGRYHYFTDCGALGG